jgi:hypothetical protein
VLQAGDQKRVGPSETTKAFVFFRKPETEQTHASDESWRHSTSVQGLPEAALLLPSYIHGEQEKSWSLLERVDTGEMLAI